MDLFSKWYSNLFTSAAWAKHASVSEWTVPLGPGSKNLWWRHPGNQFQARCTCEGTTTYVLCFFCFCLVTSTIALVFCLRFSSVFCRKDPPAKLGDILGLNHRDGKPVAVAGFAA